MHGYLFPMQFCCTIARSRDFNVILGCDATAGCNSGNSLMLIVGTGPPHTWFFQLLL